jgi:4-diphosphocytidyl-2-C-methyl-D-erythritol kinase
MALAWGRGERMLGLNALPRRAVVILKPKFDVSTADAYAWVDEELLSASDPSRYSGSDLLLITEEMLATWPKVAALNRNDFIAPVAERHPEIRAMLDAFKESGSQLCSMTGSGSGVFGVYDGHPDLSALEAFHDACVLRTHTADKVVQPVRIA